MNVRIYKPSKNTMQSGLSRTEKWVLEFEQSTARRPENLMGWTASGDTMNLSPMKFTTLDEAVDFAKKNNYVYKVMTSHERRVKPRNYVDNFKYKNTGGKK